MLDTNDNRIYEDSVLIGIDENTIKSYNAVRNAHILYLSLGKVEGDNLLPLEQR